VKNERGLFCGNGNIQKILNFYLLNAMHFNFCSLQRTDYMGLCIPLNPLS